MNHCVGEGGMVPGGVMLPGGEKTTPEVGGCPGCCCYCDLYSLAEYVYRDRLSYPPPPLAYTPVPPCPTHGEEKTSKEEDLPVIHPPPSPHMSPDVTLAFLLSLDLLRSLPQQHALHHALESRGLLKHACHRRSSSFGTPGSKLGDEEGGGVKGGETPPLLSSTSHPANLHMPHHQIDPLMRMPGGSMGVIDNARIYGDRVHPAQHTPSPTCTPTSSANQYPIMCGGNHNGEGGGGGGGIDGGGGGGDGADEEELGAYWELLDGEIRPVKPIPAYPESQVIFAEHKEMARKYLVLQQEIFNLRKNKIALQEKLSQAEKLEQLGNQRYQDKIRELENKRENLRHTHSRLRQQLEQILARQQEQQQREQQQQEDGRGGGLGSNLSLTPL
ncbi:transcription factor Maf-like isoform X1 [Penaeus indicus]|uniref:transcription factor Maf-like isoform X1 n=1 Tax=Penaeus indicus TaxID=29960 RepID=UPI00300BFD5D